MGAVLLRALPFALAAALAGCARDDIGTDTGLDPVCGNGVRETGEECDLSNPGCVGCQVVPEWTCDTAACHLICGDGVVGTGDRCESPQRDTECDMSGYWAEREADWSRDAVVNHPQAQSDWHLLHFVQSGDDFTVDEELDCGLRVSGSATVEFSPGTLRGLIYINRMDGKADEIDGGTSHPARRGTSKASDGGCAMTFERHYIQRGLDDTWLPSDFNAGVALKDMPALPSVLDPVKGTDWPAGATDPDGDGIPGAAFQITGVVTGTRNAVQRQWRQYATDPGKPAPAHAVELVVPGDYDLQESVVRVTSCGKACPLLASGSHTGNDIRPYLVLSYIGRTLGSPRVSSILGKAPRQDLNADLTTCAHIRRVIPHNPDPPK
jgi:hypothetical protein